jgi:hypothetical protein
MIQYVMVYMQYFGGNLLCSHYQMFGCQNTEELLLLFFSFGSTEYIWYQTKHFLNTEVMLSYLLPQF